MDNRKWDLDMIRIVACLLVVVVHVTGYGMEVMDPASGNWQIRNVVDSMVRCAVPVFFMLSGIVFLGREISIKQLYRKYISRIVLVWILWSSFYAFIDYVAYRKAGGNSIWHFFGRFFLGHYHMWFLPALILAYILYPVLYKMVTVCDAKIMRYLGAVVLLGVVLKESLDPFISSDVWFEVWGDFAFFKGFIGVIYFVLGYYLYKNVRILSAKYCLLIYICSVVLIAGGNMWYSLFHNTPSSVTYEYLSLGVMVSSVAIFLFLAQIFENIRPNSVQKKIIREISGCTLGIYLVHTFFIEQIFRRLGLVQSDFPAAIAIVLFTGVTFLVSLAVTWCIRRIPVIGKWVV